MKMIMLLIQISIPRFNKFFNIQPPSFKSLFMSPQFPLLPSLSDCLLLALSFHTFSALNSNNDLTLKRKEKKYYGKSFFPHSYEKYIAHAHIFLLRYKNIHMLIWCEMGFEEVKKKEAKREIELWKMEYFWRRKKGNHKRWSNSVYNPIIKCYIKAYSYFLIVKVEESFKRNFIHNLKLFVSFGRRKY